MHGYWHKRDSRRNAFVTVTGSEAYSVAQTVLLPSLKPAQPHTLPCGRLRRVGCLSVPPDDKVSTCADLAINCPAYTCCQLGRNVEAGKRQAASNATRRRSIEDPAWTPDGAESLSALLTPARFRLLGSFSTLLRSSPVVGVPSSGKI